MKFTKNVTDESLSRVLSPASYALADFGGATAFAQNMVNATKVTAQSPLSIDLLKVVDRDNKTPQISRQFSVAKSLKSEQNAS